jgi:NAD(P)-dependent dehydrogenase (short-subunit alcohol dehydrogenase family)
MDRFTVIVTGGTRGLGLAMASAFAARGHRVWSLFVRDETAAALARTQLTALDRDARVIRADATEANPALWQEAGETGERLVLINNAWPSFEPGPLHLQDWEAFDRGFQQGLKAAWQCSRAALRPMSRAGGGTIVNVLTRATAGSPPGGFGAYVTAKHALRGLTLSLAAEYAPRGIRVCSISPGLMDTGFTQAWDARFLEAAKASTELTDPTTVAARVLEAVESPDLAGRGEDLPLLP